MLCGWKTKETLNHATGNSTRRCNPRSGFQRFYFNLQVTNSAARSLIDSDRFLLSRFLFPQNSKSRVVKSLDRKSTTTTRKRESTQANCDINSKRRFKRAPERKRIDNLLIRQIDQKKIQNCEGKSKTEVQKRADIDYQQQKKRLLPLKAKDHKLLHRSYFHGEAGFPTHVFLGEIWCLLADSEQERVSRMANRNYAFLAWQKTWRKTHNNLPAGYDVVLAEHCRFLLLLLFFLFFESSKKGFATAG